MSDVSDLLDVSRMAHRTAILARQKRDFATNEAQLRVAYDKRQAALALDPQRSDAGWSTDAPGQHDKLMQFYAERCV